ncbi:lycopene beta-cyclase CrtY [Sphingomonas aracearum]|uniref:Lycopene cyclase n=1 Tax=Sphingomonas aracearum TaxID=2283317 RepID=A0A369VQX6_9SPHN|nr:lycopene beta-cyclase CrtY [Sphingomonas aracearum]RDE04784.1 lycopene cyclase [Sphingomonas aracearum]
MASIHRCDVAIVGAGLAGGLIALALRARRPDCDVRLIDAHHSVGGNHLWSFFEGDIAKANRRLVAPIISYGWDGYDVAFPAHRRSIGTRYFSVESSRLDRVVRATLPPEALMLGRKVLGASPTAVVLADGDRVEAGGVIDARGPADLAHLDLGWQKFVGRELTLRAPHGRARPTIMDATVPQLDGYRFVYTLPFSATKLFVEDTYYSDGYELHRSALSQRIGDYARTQGWDIAEAGREETGVLPVAMGGDFEGYWASGGNRCAKAGMRAGLFHPTTGYSLPDAVRTAALIARQSDLSGKALHDVTHAFAARTWNARGFYRLLDRMLFRAAEPAERYRVLERFYRLSPGLIGRFYAGHSTMTDRLRVLAGKPPVPIGRAIKAIGSSDARVGA